MGIINPPWDRYDVCLSGESILRYGDYKCLILSALEHADDIHLYHNMASLLMKGQSLERRYVNFSKIYVQVAKLQFNGFVLKKIIQAVVMLLLYELLALEKFIGNSFSLKFITQIS